MKDDNTAQMALLVGHFKTALDTITAASRPKNNAAEDPLVMYCRQRAGIKADDSLPIPFEISNGRLLKVPWLWPIYWAHTKVTKTQLLDSYGLPGVLSQAIDKTLKILYPDASEDDRTEVRILFCQGAFIFMSASIAKPLSIAAIGDLGDFLEPILKQARLRIVFLDSAVLMKSFGSAQSAVFIKMNTVLHPTLFAASDEALIARLSKDVKEHPASKRPRLDDKQDKNGSKGRRREMVCKKCKKPVVGMSMQDHKKECA